jgi:DNA-binding PadR family transcriptional regulator
MGQRACDAGAQKLFGGWTHFPKLGRQRSVLALRSGRIVKTIVMNTIVQATLRTMTSSKPSMLSDLAFHVLLSLADGPSHGYAIGKAIEEQSGGRLDPTTGALYQALRRMTEDGLVSEVDGPKAVDARRRYFALTTQGKRAAATEAARLDGLVRIARKRRLFPQRA